MNDNLSIIKKIINFNDLSQSQIDRLNLQNEAYSSLVRFLHDAINKIQIGNTLKQKLEIEIDKLINPDLEEDPTAEKFSPNQLLTLFSMLLKYDSEQSMAIINTLRESLKVNIVNNNNPDGNNLSNLFPNDDSNAAEEFSKQEIQQAKKLLKTAETLQESEFSLDEIEDLLKNKKKK